MDAFHFNVFKFRYSKCFIKLFAIRPLEESTLISTMYAIFLLIVTIFFLFFEMYGRIMERFNGSVNATTRTIVIGTLNTVVDVVCNVVITLPALVLSKSFKNDIVADIEAFDLLLAKYTETDSNSKHTYLNLMVVNNVFFAIILCNSLSQCFTENMEFSKKVFVYYIFDHFYRLRISVLVFCMYYMLKDFYSKIISINALLKNAFKQYHHPNSARHRQLTSLRDVVRNVSEMHAKFIQIINYINQLFGWQMLLVFLNYVTLFTTAYESGLRIATLQHKTKHSQTSVWLTFSMIYSLV